MRKTTVYLPEALKLRLERVASERGISEAEVIRAAIEQFTGNERPRPRAPLFRGVGKTNVARQAEEILAEGLGRD